MKYVSIDIETTGIDNQKNQMTQFAAIIDDTIIPKPIEELPSLMVYVAHPSYNINSGLAAKEQDFHTLETVKKISEFQHSSEPKTSVFDGSGAMNSKGEIFTTPKDLGRLFAKWLAANGYPRSENGKFTVISAGKNVSSFDIPFIKATVPDYYKELSFSHRCLDPGILYFDPLNDVVIPDLAVCKKRANLEEHVSHDALDDSIDVIKLLRYHFNKKWR